MRSGVLPPAPEELMQASRISFNFINAMASAQKLENVTAIQNLMINVSQMAQLDPNIMDNINLDAAVQICAEGLNVPTTAIRTEDELIQLRQSKAEQQQAMQQQQMMQQVGQAGLDVIKKQGEQMTPEQLGQMIEQQ